MLRRFLAHLEKKKTSEPILLYDVSLGTDNLGDEIIMQYAMKELAQLFPFSRFIHLPTHYVPDSKDFQECPPNALSIVCGTNILCPDVDRYNLWCMAQGRLKPKSVVFMAVGANSYGDFTLESRKLYRALSARSILHSARDFYTFKKMREIGLDNTLNTGCLTMWGLTKEKCASIPKQKGHKAVLTLTAHRPGAYAAVLVSETLKRYDEVFFWPQGTKDLEFLHALPIDASRISILSRSLKAFEDILKEQGIDYVGTRLHGGIHALNHGRRAIIVEVDNRATEIAASTGLPTVAMDIPGALGSAIESQSVFDIEMPWDAISQWRSQWESR